jgi:hypothetical protein
VVFKKTCSSQVRKAEDGDRGSDLSQVRRSRQGSSMQGIHCNDSPEARELITPFWKRGDGIKADEPAYWKETQFQ